MTAISLLFPAALQDEFRVQARKAFPKETYAFLLGSKADDAWEVKALWKPPDVEDVSTKDAVNEPSEWISEAWDWAEAQDPKLKVLGDIHTHPYQSYENECVPSEGDWQEVTDNQEFWGGVTGICLVWKTRVGLRTRIKMYRLSPVFTRSK